MIGIIVAAFFGFGLLGMPLAIALGFAAFGGMIYSGIDFNIMPQRMMHSVNQFQLMSIPFFMLAGELMIRGGIMERLIDFANVIVGRMRGGLAQITVLSAMGLSSVSGAAVADASALGATLVPPLKKAYSPGFASAVVAAASNLGPIIPPSGAMIVYALMAGSSVSVGAMFMAGILPGIIMTIGMMALCYVIARMRNYPTTGEKLGWREKVRETRRAFIVFMMPIIVVGGIVGGVFTATEGAAIAVAYSLFIGFFVTRKLRFSDLPGAVFSAAVTSSLVIALIAFASTVTFLFTIDLIPLKLATFIKGVTDDPQVFILLVMGMLIIVGMFLESNASYIMLVPLFAPLASSYGIDPIYFGFLFVLNLVVGMLTPPVGVLLFVVCAITRLPMSQMIIHVWPFVLLQYGVLILCFLFPAIVITLPRLAGY